jgi:hypothetical protein
MRLEFEAVNSRIRGFDVYDVEMSHEIDLTYKIFRNETINLKYDMHTDTLIVHLVLVFSLKRLLFSLTEHAACIFDSGL